MLEFILAHIILEMVFYNVLLNRIDPKANYTMGLDMWMHHIAVAFGGAHNRFNKLSAARVQPPTPHGDSDAFCLRNRVAPSRNRPRVGSCRHLLLDRDAAHRHGDQHVPSHRIPPGE